MVIGKHYKNLVCQINKIQRVSENIVKQNGKNLLT